MKYRLRVLAIDARHPQTYFLLAVVWLLLFLTLFVLTSTAAAHSELVKSEPQDGEVLDESPAQVTTWFSEELDAELSTIRVFNTQNDQVDNGDGGVDLNDLEHLSMFTSLPLLSAGTYTVKWAAVSAEDGDATEGEFTFSMSGGGTVSESESTPSHNTYPTWLFGGVALLLLFVVLIWLVFLRREIPG